MAPYLRGCLALLVLAAVVAPAFAINANDASGSPTFLTQLGGPGDSISAYSGDLEISVPIGPRWSLPGISWGLSLNYSSKIWRLREGAVPGTELQRKGPFGVGWRLTMGRIMRVCRFGGCGPDSLNNLHYEDSAGTLHPIKMESTISPGTILNGHTTDGTCDPSRYSAL